MARGNPKIGYVRLFSRDPKLEVVALLGPERAGIESGYGGWEEIARPRRPPLTTFKATPAIRVTLPLLLDNWRQGRSIEAAISTLAKMGRPVASNGEPPRVFYSVRGDAIPYQGRAFVVEQIAWGEALVNERGNRVRQAATLSLLEYVEDVYLTEESAANRVRTKTLPRRGRGSPAKRIVAKRAAGRRSAALPAASAAADFGAGEDLLSIAARVLGDANRWVEIAKLNGIRDPRAIRPGQVLRLP